MRTIDYIVLHCTATPQTATVESIKRYWREVMKWRRVGYHFLIEPSGKINHLLDIEEVTNGVKGYNKSSIHISYIGGVDSKGKAFDNRTVPQKIAQIELIKELKEQFPKAKILGHRDFPNVQKDCPSFDVAEWLAEVGLE
jgi:N-acetylmuramoyl-L-alanine amidase